MVQGYRGLLMAYRDRFSKGCLGLSLVSGVLEFGFKGFGAAGFWYSDAWTYRVSESLVQGIRALALKGIWGSFDAFHPKHPRL